MSHVGIFMFPGYGHVNPTLELSRHLVAAGHRVTYVVEERHTASVTAVGARVVDYVWRRDAIGPGAVSGEDIGELGLAFLRESIGVILPRTLTAFDSDVPDLVLYDLESFFTARTAARRWDRPTGQLFPYVATNEHFSLAQEVFDGAGEHVQQCIHLVAAQLAAEGREPDEVWPFLANFDRRNLALLPREEVLLLYGSSAFEEVAGFNATLHADFEVCSQLVAVSPALRKAFVQSGVFSYPHFLVVV